jgi:hypothetical protein
VYVKRNLTPSEWIINIHGKLVHPPLAKERLMNEAAAIAYVREHLPEIPVPNIRAAFEDHGRFYIIEDEVPRVNLSELSEDKKTAVLPELERCIAMMQSHKSKILRAFGPKICLPYRL